MTITLCGSTNFFSDMDNIQKELESKGHIVFHPRNTAVDFRKKLKFLHMDESHKTDFSHEGRYKKNGLIISHLIAIKKSDAILVVNLEKNNIENYIGGNTFLEMGFAFAFDKKIFILNSPAEESPYYDEITGLLPTIIHNNLNLIK